MTDHGQTHSPVGAIVKLSRSETILGVESETNKRVRTMIRSFDDLKAELLANPDVRAEYEARAAEFEIAAESIAARIKAASRMHNPMMLRSGNKI